MDYELATTTATAYPTFEAFLKACKSGTVPSLHQGHTDELPLRRAKTLLSRYLERERLPHII